jgi:mannose-6-phosphate isomerase-like protein (cupin superfamily)
MGLKVITLVILAAATSAPSAAHAVETYSSTQFRQVVAQAVVPDRNNERLYFGVLAGTFWGGEVHRRAAADGVYYQYTGTVEIEAGGKTTTLAPGQGIFLAAGTAFTLRSRGSRPSPCYLQFLLSPAPDAAVASVENEALVELYRSPTPVPGLMHERNLLSLVQVPVPPQSLPDPLHRRTGAALHYIVSGVGAEFADGRALARGPGSVSYEPAGFTYQWSNPGLKPLIYLLFNVNPKGTDAVVGSDRQAADPFLRDPHLTVAMFCVAISMILTLAVSSGTIADHHRERRSKLDDDDDHL